MQVRFNQGRPGLVREIRASDLKRMGSESKKALVFNQGNAWTVEVPDEVGELLVGQLPEEFATVEADDAKSSAQDDSEESVGSDEGVQNKRQQSITTGQSPKA